MLRRQLRPTLAEAARAAQLSGNNNPAPTSSSGVSVPAGQDVIIRSETSNDVPIFRADGQESTETHVVSMPEKGIKLSRVAEKVEHVESVVKSLQAGVSTQGRWNTVSTSEPPASADGYPDGAWWTKVASADDMTPQALWTVEDNKWVSKPLPAGQTVAPYLNTGLISAGTIAAAVIKSDEFWTALSGKRVGFNKDGLHAYEEDGTEVVRINGTDNYISGRGELGGWAFKSEHGTSVIARSDYGDVTIDESGNTQQNVPHIETSQRKGTVITHGSDSTTPYLLLQNDRATIYAKSTTNQFAQVGSGINGNNVYANLYALPGNNTQGVIQTFTQPDQVNSLMAAQADLPNNNNIRALCRVRVGGGQTFAALTAASGNEVYGFMAKTSQNISMSGPLSLGTDNSSTFKLFKITRSQGLQANIGFSAEFNVGVPSLSGCHYWPISVLTVENSSTGTYNTKIQKFNPDSGYGELYVRKLTGGIATQTDFIIVFVMLRSHDWHWD